jgi:hypothetical protein
MRFSVLMRLRVLRIGQIDIEWTICYKSVDKGECACSVRTARDKIERQARRGRTETAVAKFARVGPSERGEASLREGTMAVLSGTAANCIRVYVTASDPVSRAGIISQRQSHSCFQMVAGAEIEAEVVAFIVADQLVEETAGVTKAIKRRGVSGLVLILTWLDDAGLMRALAPAEPSDNRKSFRGHSGDGRRRGRLATGFAGAYA